MKTRIEETRDCLHFRLRRITRLLTRHYDQVFRQLGLRVTQFNILAVLSQTGPVPVTKLADLIGLERSALARNLKLIAREGFVLLYEGEDRRTLVAELAPAGTRKLTQALPVWKRAQDRLLAQLGSAESARLTAALAKLRAALKD